MSRVRNDYIGVHGESGAKENGQTGSYEPFSKLLVSPLITPIVVLYIIPFEGV